MEDAAGLAAWPGLPVHGTGAIGTDSRLIGPLVAWDSVEISSGITIAAGMPARWLSVGSDPSPASSIIPLALSRHAPRD
ncbi:hypothetical protein [Cryobacterium sp. Y82]|uniref:hypothetical protein n=1 Tax=Cryobacterium sp. Y82 TaxID=2045017 RepID=UPI0011B0579A|nr:hypothetical protein [Cryobacterium sp. Y82]